MGQTSVQGKGTPLLLRDTQREFGNCTSNPFTDLLVTISGTPVPGIPDSTVPQSPCKFEVLKQSRRVERRRLPESEVPPGSKIS